MTDPADDILSDLGNELRSVAPSPAFAAAVRARVAGEAPAPRARFVFWALGGIAVMAAAVVIVVLGVWRGPALPLAPAVPDTQRAAVPTTESVASAPPPRAANVAAPVRGVRSESQRPGRALVAAARADTSEGPALEVITNQREVIARVWAQAQRRGVVTELTRSETSEPSPGELIVTPLGVDPIVVEALPRPDAPVASAPVIRKFTLDRARSER